MGHVDVKGMLGRWRAWTADQRRLETERPGESHPRAGSWHVVNGLGHLYLNPARDEPDSPARPVCDAAVMEGAPKMNVKAGDPVCQTCDTYLSEVHRPAHG